MLLLLSPTIRTVCLGEGLKGLLGVTLLHV
jgi:hypothetical protein